jgi:transposase
MQPFRHQLDRLTTIPGFGTTVAQVFLAETGGDMAAFPTAAHLAGWAQICPGNHASAGKRKSGKTGRGNTYLVEILVEAAWAASHTHTYFSGLYRHFLRTFGKRGKQQALVAVAHALLITAWHVLANDTDFRDLGPDYLATRRDAKERQRYLIRELEKLGYQVQIQPAA